MNFGQLLGGAGVVARGFRSAEQAELQARQNQLAIEEQNRLADLRAQMARMELPSFQPAGAPDLTRPIAQLQIPEALPRFEVPAAAPAPTTEAPILGGTPVPPTTPSDILPAPVTGMQLGSRAPARPTVPFGQEIPNPQTNPRMFQSQQEAIRLAELRVQNLETGLQRLTEGGASPSLIDTQRRRIADERQRVESLRYGLQRVAPTLRVPAETDAMALFTQLEGQHNLPSGVLNAVMLAESGGRPGQTSRAGAQGYFQFMPATARQYGVTVNDFESEAKGAARFLGDMLKATNGDLRQALAAYNWGIGNVQKKGMDKLPKETQDYIPRVLSFLPQAQAAAPSETAGPPAPAAPAVRTERGVDMFNQPTEVQVGAVPPRGVAAAAPAAPAAPAVRVPTAVAAPVQVNPAAINLANPESIPFEQQRLNQVAQQQMTLLTRQRNEAAQLAQIYMRSGTTQGIDAAMRLRGTIDQLDAGMLQLQQQTQQGQTYLQGMQGLQEFSLANDPRRLSAVWSQYAGVPVGIQPRSDGKFNIIVNGQRTKEGVDASDIANSARLAFDQTYRQQQATTGAAMSMKRFESLLKREETYADNQAKMLKDLFVEQLKGNIQQGVERLKQMRYDVKPSGAGDGTIIITPPGGEPPYVFNPTGRTIEIDGVKIQSNAAYPISGLPTYGGTKPAR